MTLPPVALICLSASMDGVCNLVLMRVLTGVKPRAALLPAALLYHIVLALLEWMDVLDTLTFVRTVINLAAFFLMNRYVFGLRGKRLWFRLLEFEISLILISVFSMFLLHGAGYEMNWDIVEAPDLLPYELSNMLSRALLVGLILLWRKGALPLLRRHPTLPYVLRMALAAALIVLTTVSRAALPGIAIGSGIAGEELVRATALFTTATAIAYILAASLIVQDARMLWQFRRNETLQKKQETIDKLLASMRGFRHNLGNMLCGMEGALASGNSGEAREYYRQLIEKYALQSSENIVQIQNLASPALSALLLSKLDLAQKCGVPAYLFIEKAVRFRGLSQSDLCEIVGALLDNALEAAQESPAPYISLEMRRLENETELVVRNTFAEDAPLCFAEGSTKPGHEGVGIASVRGLLARNGASFLNMRVAGRYVEAQVLIG